MTLSQDLRLRIVDLVASGLLRRAAARRLRFLRVQLSGLSNKPNFWGMLMSRNPKSARASSIRFDMN